MPIFSTIIQRMLIFIYYFTVLLLYYSTFYSKSLRTKFVEKPAHAGK